MAGSKTALKKIQPTIERILSLREDMMALSDAALRNRTYAFRRRLAEGETEDDILVEAYAVVREAARRVLHMEHYPSQLIGGVILHQGRIAEMRTGEGKTLVATLPSYLNALSGKGVHVVTTNDYLAERDAGQMGKVHEFLGLTVGSVLSGMEPEKRKEAYECDITYTTNAELGFDYLRDNMAKTLSGRVQRGFHYCIIDEVDSVLIDDAGTPLILSGAGARSTKLYGACDVLARRMERGEEPPELSKIDMVAGVMPEETGDYMVLEKEKRVVLTEAGIRRTEKYFRIENLADVDSLEIRHNMDLALRANALMERDRDYVVTDGEVLIVDPLTGRTMPGRRYSDGLHQAIEAKEHVHIKKENRTTARITYQNFFHKYEKLSGMTGTGRAQEKEFIDVYGMDIVVVPTNRPVQRVDREDVFFHTKQAKLDAVAERVLAANRKGQPVLVGTVSVADSEELSERFSAMGIVHSVLNAKHHKQEAEIVAMAGRTGAVTIATSMAGRGTDIKLDEKAKASGGLLVIGTERYDSRRIDDQLCGRSGRQGDPGESVFCLSLEDGLFKKNPAARLARLYGEGAGEGIRCDALSRLIVHTQKAMEQENCAARRQMVEYDCVLSEQRELVYARRLELLRMQDIHGEILRQLRLAAQDAHDATEDLPATERVRTAAHTFDGIILPYAIRRCETLPDAEFVDGMAGELIKRYEQLAENFTDEAYLKKRERELLLDLIDRHWAEHMEQMELLRDGIGLVSYAQKNPVVEYRKAAFRLFDRMNTEIRHDMAATLLKATDLN